MASIIKETAKQNDVSSLDNDLAKVVPIKEDYRSEESPY